MAHKRISNASSAKRCPSSRLPHAVQRAEPDPGFAEIRALAASLRDLQHQMVAVYAPIVQGIIQSRSQNVQEIEHTLDHLLDCACIPEGLTLFKSLCRHYYGIDPAAAADYVYTYRDMWDSEAAPDQNEETPAPICRKGRGRGSGVNAARIPKSAGVLQAP